MLLGTLRAIIESTDALLGNVRALFMGKRGIGKPGIGRGRRCMCDRMIGLREWRHKFRILGEKVRGGDYSGMVLKAAERCYRHAPHVRKLKNPPFFCGG